MGPVKDCRPAPAPEDKSVASIVPVVGQWYRNVRSDVLEVVAIDRDDGTIEIQHYDGTVGEIELEAWSEVIIEAVQPPEDWSGSMDVEREDYGVDRDDMRTAGWRDPLDIFDRAE